mmetsp:Transcript_99363/g.206983  ORF Transcript_99363/g.206983 Transcript_99363/m.206983 type:complete len:151 (-) Transcript_99363:33-485(-)
MGRWECGVAHRGKRVVETNTTTAPTTTPKERISGPTPLCQAAIADHARGGKGEKKEPGRRNVRTNMQQRESSRRSKIGEGDPAEAIPSMNECPPNGQIAKRSRYQEREWRRGSGQTWHIWLTEWKCKRPSNTQLRGWGREFGKFPPTHSS